MSIDILAAEKWLLAFTVVVPNMRFPKGFFQQKDEKMATILSCVLIAAILVLSWCFCLTGNNIKNINEIKFLTAKQAAELVATHEGDMLFFDGLTSIDKDVAQELAKFNGGYLSLDVLTSMNKDVLEILKSNQQFFLKSTAIKRTKTSAFASGCRRTFPFVRMSERFYSKGGKYY